MVAAAVVGGAALTAGVGYMSSKNAASTQAGAANRAADMQQAQYDQTRKDLSPYNDFGKNAINPLMSAMGYNPDFSVNQNNPLQQRFSAPTADQAQQTPGYQFTLDQGLKAVQNSASARGLGTSGAAMKGASSYATGLADSTYNDVYNRALQTFNTNYNSASQNANRLSGIVQQGQNSAAQTGSMGMTAANNAGNMLTSGANATASGIVGGANALTSAINGGLNLALTNAIYSANTGNGLFSGNSNTGVFGGNNASTASNLTNWGA
ncbi:MAG: DNA transfer protein p32 [Patescibacteria group bacterium]|nr:DNA transfer protein p32 [Patescibacteria group bacterium]